MIFANLYGRTLRTISEILTPRHVNCCNPEDKSNGGWGIFNAILGWQNSATIGSVVSYCLYWIFVTAALIIMRIDERRVVDGKATLWRTMLGKGPKGSEEAIEEGPVDAAVDATNDPPKDGAIVGVDRSIENLIV
jgi:Iron permease FTR1 family